MQSSEPVAGNPWPHGMRISVEESDVGLMRLLFMRTAWGLSAIGVPAVTGLHDVGESRLPDSVSLPEANYRWRDEWDESWHRFDGRRREVRPPDAATRALLDSTSDDELMDVFARWSSRFWGAGLDDAAHARWCKSLWWHPESLDESPERRSLPALVAAWQSGLTTIIQLPFEGYYSDRISTTHLVVSGETRHDEVLYSRALATPTGQCSTAFSAP